MCVWMCTDVLECARLIDVGTEYHQASNISMDRGANRHHIGTGGLERNENLGKKCIKFSRKASFFIPPTQHQS